jgi:hypothetical protein
VEGKVLSHGKKETIGVFLWWDNSGLVLVRELFVFILDSFHQMVRSHEINDAHPKFLTVLYY